MPKKITIIRQGNLIGIEAGPKAIARLRNELCYEETVFLRGRAKQLAKRRGDPVVCRQTWDCYTIDAEGRLITPFGFMHRIVKRFEEAGYEIHIDNRTRLPRKLAYAPDWSQLEGVKLRYRQKEALEIIAKHENGRIDCPPGWGKSFLIACAAMVFRKAKIAVITRRVEIMTQRLYPELCSYLPDVGSVGGGRRKRLTHRVTCYTAGSIHHADGDEDFVFFDEGHEAASDDCASKMGIFRHARMFAFSASWDMRLDNKDMRTESMFGPIRLKITYTEAVKQGMVVPIVVQLSDYASDIDPCLGLEDTDRERAGVWANNDRNALIVRDARLYGPDIQCLITVKTLEHALHLRKLLPEYEIVYGEDTQTDKDWSWFYYQGLIDDSFEPMTSEKRQSLREAFTAGKLKKVIATPIWNVGVDMRHLQVIIRADASGSRDACVQIPGRGSRILVLGSKRKPCAVVHDYRDSFSRSFALRANKRIEEYRAQKWTVIYPDNKSKARLIGLTEMENVE